MESFGSPSQAERTRSPTWGPSAAVTAPDAGSKRRGRLSDMHRSRHRGDSGRRWNMRSRSEEHTSELQSRLQLVCRLFLVKKKNKSRINRCCHQYDIVG